MMVILCSFSSNQFQRVMPSGEQSRATFSRQVVTWAPWSRSIGEASRSSVAVANLQCLGNIGAIASTIQFRSVRNVQCSPLRSLSRLDVQFEYDELCCRTDFCTDKILESSIDSINAFSMPRWKS